MLPRLRWEVRSDSNEFNRTNPDSRPFYLPCRVCGFLLPFRPSLLLGSSCECCHVCAGRSDLIQMSSTEPILTLARFTCPVVFAGSYFHFGLRFYWVLLANAATYALVGLIVETLRLDRKSV